MSKYGDFPGPYFTTFGLNMGKYRPEKTPFLDTLHTVITVHPLSHPIIRKDFSELYLYCCFKMGKMMLFL